LSEARVLEDYIVDDQFNKAQVIACTPVVSANRMMRDRQFSTLFIDEAAASTGTHVLDSHHTQPYA